MVSVCLNKNSRRTRSGLLVNDECAGWYVTSKVVNELTAEVNM